MVLEQRSQSRELANRHGLTLIRSA
jgi:hypothetical protein